MNSYQHKKYLDLVNYIEINLRQTITIHNIEDVCHYSYRNMNRIFLALQGETIGRHIKRRRLEKAAEFLVYSNTTVSDICFGMQFNDMATFSKAFKKQFKLSPTVFRKLKKTFKAEDYNITTLKDKPLSYNIETLPEFNYIYLENYGSLNDYKRLKKLWQNFLSFCDTKGLIDNNSYLFGMILDDNDITDEIFCRYRACLITERPMDFSLESVLSAKHSLQKYARFIHKGKDSESEKTYQNIYSNWPETVDKEIADKPVLEFYHNILKSTSKSITEVYIPID